MENPVESTESKAQDQTYLQMVPAVDQATRILFLLANMVGGESSLTELSREAGISKSKGLAILNTLRSSGLVTRNDRTKAYRLGPNLLLLSRSLLNHTDLAQEAGPFLEELAMANGCTMLLTVLSGESVFVVARRHAPGGAYVAVNVGNRYPIPWGAHGRAILATMSPEEVERRLAPDSVLLASETGNEKIDLAALRTDIEEARRTGYGQSLGTTWSGLNAVAAVLRVSASPGEAMETSRVVGCLVAVGHFGREKAAEIGEGLVTAGPEISRRLGPLMDSVNLHFPLSRPLFS
ncbi:MAG: IclR family transcriptional regulator [Actinobacteria bacterium]|nr:IclR family transcriptional regulator [Actinomycetota bacterium]